MKRIILTLSCFFICLNTYAFCPACVFVAGAGIGLSQYLGIDDLITGLWLGSLTIGMIVLTNQWLRQKKGECRWRDYLVGLVYYFSLIWPLYRLNLIGHELNQLFGIDRLLLGIILGSGCFYGSHAWYLKLKKQNHGHAYFPYQKVIMPIGFLIILSIIATIWLT